MNLNEKILEFLKNVVERGEFNIDYSVFALLDKKLHEKIQKLMSKLATYLDDSVTNVMKRYEVVQEIFPEYAKELPNVSPKITIALLIKELKIKIYSSGEIVIKSKGGKFNYKRKLKQISQFFSTYNDPEKIKLIFTTEELLHLFSSVGLSIDLESRIKDINREIANLIMEKIKKGEILPFRNQDQELAFQYFVNSLKEYMEETEGIYDWEHREKVFEDLEEDPNYTLFFDKKKGLLYIPSKFIRFIIERNPRMILTVFELMDIRDVRIWQTSYSRYGEKVTVRYYVIPLKSLNKVLETLGYAPIDVNVISEEELNRRIKEKAKLKKIVKDLDKLEKEELSKEEEAKKMEELIEKIENLAIEE